MLLLMVVVKVPLLIGLPSLAGDGRPVVLGVFFFYLSAVVEVDQRFDEYDTAHKLDFSIEALI